MSRTFSPLAVALALAASPAALATPAPGKPVLDELVFGEPIAYHNMTVVPVRTTHGGPFRRYDLLEPALKARTLEVRELAGKSDEARVSAVHVRNQGQQAVFLLGGEMILGGKQDRIIQADTVIPADGKWRKVDVFCVEQGRWRGGNMRFSSGNALAHGKLRAAALTGNQSEVWAEVSRKNAEHGTESDTQTYRRTIQNADVRRRIANYRGELERRIPADIPLAGFVFGINGQIRVADLFGNPVLVGDLREKLLSAYILEALEHDVDGDAGPVQATKAQEFVGKARKAPRKEGKASGRAKSWKKKAKGFIGSETYDEDTGRRLRESYMAD